MQASNYPPGVTGREPQITGEWPADELIDHALEVLGKMEDELDDLMALMDEQAGHRAAFFGACEQAKVRLGEAKGSLPPTYADELDAESDRLYELQREFEENE